MSKYYALIVVALINLAFAVLRIMSQQEENMTSGYGNYYLDAHKGRRELKRLYSVKRVRGGWLVYDIHTSDGYLLLKTRLRAYYTATRMNGTDVSNYFDFGTSMFGVQQLLYNVYFVCRIVWSNRLKCTGIMIAVY